MWIFCIYSFVFLLFKIISLSQLLSCCSRLSQTKSFLNELLKIFFAFQLMLLQLICDIAWDSKWNAKSQLTLHIFLWFQFIAADSILFFVQFLHFNTKFMQHFLNFYIWFWIDELLDDIVAKELQSVFNCLCLHDLTFQITIVAKFW